MKKLVHNLNQHQKREPYVEILRNKYRKRGWVREGKLSIPPSTFRYCLLFYFDILLSDATNFENLKFDNKIDVTNNVKIQILNTLVVHDWIIGCITEQSVCYKFSHYIVRYGRTC